MDCTERFRGGPPTEAERIPTDPKKGGQPALDQENVSCDFKDGCTGPEKYCEAGTVGYISSSGLKESWDKDLLCDVLSY